MKDSVIELLRCPVCHADMVSDVDKRVCHCTGKKTHCFDFARSGYLHLGGSHAGEGDSKDAVMARRVFLDCGYYSGLSEKINEILDSIQSEHVLDAGCGEGYYTNRMAASRNALGIDLSKHAIDYAARRSIQGATGAGFAVASVFDLPIADERIDVVTNLFAPCVESEYCRVLKKVDICFWWEQEKII